MSNRQIIRAFARSHNHKVIGLLHLNDKSSDMDTGKWFWYEDNAGTEYMIIPKSRNVAIYANDKAIFSR